MLIWKDKNIDKKKHCCTNLTVYHKFGLIFMSKLLFKCKHFILEKVQNSKIGRLLNFRKETNKSDLFMSSDAFLFCCQQLEVYSLELSVCVSKRRRIYP